MNEVYQFTPPFILKNPHLQTLISYVIHRCDEPASKTHLVDLTDGDKVAVEITTPANWKPHDPTVLMMHGIGGSAQSPYLIRMAAKLEELNIQSVRLNFRGMGNGVGLAKMISHGGSSNDVFEVVQYLNTLFPSSPLILIGFSLSGNILLKLAGEHASLQGVEKIIAVCPAVNLKDSSQRLEKWQNRIYQKSILASIIEAVQSKKNQFSYKPKRSLKTCKTLQAFDSLYTAPASGFLDADDYYQRCSSLALIPNIQMPCQILFSKDDPLIDYKGAQQLKLPSNIELLMTTHGGHMGFLTYSKTKNLFWMDSLLLHWILKE